MINSKKFGSKQQKKTSGEQIDGAVVFFFYRPSEIIQRIFL